MQRKGMLGLAFGLALVAGSAAAQELNVYSARHYPSDEQLFAGFTKATGIKINLIEGSAEQLVERIKREGKSSPADVLVTVDAGNLWRAQQAGVFQPVKSEQLEKLIPANLREPAGHWFGFATRARVIVYDKAKVKPEQLSTYEDLADPKWKGQVLIRSSGNIYNQSLLASLIAAHGPEKAEAWAKGIVANMARPPQGGDTDQLKAVAAGEGTIAVSNTYYLARLASSSKPEEKAVADKLGVFFPNQNDRGTHVNISGAGVAANAPNKDAAVKFLEYMASPEAQRIFADANNEFPAVAGVEPAAVLKGWGSFKVDPIAVAKYGENNPEAVKVMDRAGWK
ncbi:MAG TPA: Fe(3+) ABC transporter substrate-binding protein [Alphaproteobacteria bacterium]|nr:Fe(3+) ABC transporter substrate-binding protein [Alphaproteobacteria bacterium]